MKNLERWMKTRDELKGILFGEILVPTTDYIELVDCAERLSKITIDTKIVAPSADGQWVDVPSTKCTNHDGPCLPDEIQTMTCRWCGQSMPSYS